jgi:hypothetical protein
MKFLILVGEVQVGDGVVHQGDLVQAVAAERLTAIPKELPPMGTIAVVVGRLLRGKEPVILKQAKARGVPVTTVDSLLTPEVTAKIVQLLEAKPKRESYEERALISLKATAATQPATSPEPTHEKPVRGKGKKARAAANE